MDNRSLLSGIAIGAALAMAFDPDSGRRRRALIRDKVVRGTGRTGEVLDARLRDMGSRARDLAAAARRQFLHDEADDERLRERVRSKIGRVCSHPRAVDVYVHDGEVTLIGPVLADEVRALLAAAASVRGVHSVLNELEPHETAEGIPSLQGTGRRLEFVPAGPGWAPGARTIVGAAALAAGGLALAYSRR